MRTANGRASDFLSYHLSLSFSLLRAARAPARVYISRAPFFTSSSTPLRTRPPTFSCFFVKSSAAAAAATLPLFSFSSARALRPPTWPPTFYNPRATLSPRVSRECIVRLLLLPSPRTAELIFFVYKSGVRARSGSDELDDVRRRKLRRASQTRY